MASIDLSEYFDGVSATYDDATGDFTTTLTTGLIKEQAIIALIQSIETAVQGYRTDLNQPVSEKEFPDNPAEAFVSRENSDGSISETQIEYTPQFVLWFVSPSFDPTNAVNSSDPDAV